MTRRASRLPVTPIACACRRHDAYKNVGDSQQPLTRESTMTHAREPRQGVIPADFLMCGTVGGFLAAGAGFAQQGGTMTSGEVMSWMLRWPRAKWVESMPVWPHSTTLYFHHGV